MSLLTPSGGLVYHWRATRYRSGLWAPFRRALETWLQQRFPQPAGELVLVGPSAGHCLPLELLRRFEQLTLLEPDPLARAWLTARLGRRPARVESDDLLLRPLLSEQPGLDALLAERPAAAVLFCNMLGQLQFALEDEEQLRFQAEFSRRIVPALAGRVWASFHDRWSVDWPSRSRTPVQLDFERQPDDQQLGAAWFDAEGPPLTVHDHGTSTLFPAEFARRYLSWQLTPSSLHLIEAVGAGPTAVAPGGSRR